MTMTDIAVKEYGDSLKQKAEHLIQQQFPEKIIKLNALLEISNFQRHNFSDVHQNVNISVPPTAPVHYKTKSKRHRSDSYAKSEVTITDGRSIHLFPKGMVFCNKKVCDLIHIAKPHIRELIEDSNLLKMWISFLIPKIEDGNNFGVSIQKGVLAEIESVQSGTEALFDEIAGYFFLRAKIVSKVAKYPYIDDYRKAVKELDEKEYLSLWHVLCEIRNHYCSLHDIIIKNLGKIKKPRTSNADSLY